MIFTAAQDYAMLNKIEIIGISGYRSIADDTTRASMPNNPGRWGLGWADLLVLSKGVERAVWHMKLGDDGQPATRRRYGLIRWHK